MPKTTEIKVREEPGVKKRAAMILHSYGLDISTAVRMFLRQVVRTKSVPLRMESGYTADGESAILEADREHEEDLRMGRAKTYSSAKKLFNELNRKK